MAALGGWFTSRFAPPPRKGAPMAASQGAGNTGTLVSAESLKTFGGVTFAVTVVWGGLESALAMAHNNLVGLGLSLAFCGFLLYDDLADPNRSPLPRVPMRVFAAVINAFIIYGAASAALSQGKELARTAAPAASNTRAS